MQVNSPNIDQPQWAVDLDLARRQLDDGAFAKAYATGQGLLRFAAHQAELHYILGKSLFHLEHHDEAIVFLQQALKIESKNPDYLIALGRALLVTEKYEDAGRLFEYAFCLNPSLVQAHYWWVESYRQRGDSHLIVTYLATHHSDKPSTAMALVNALLDLGDRERAFSVLHGAVTTHDEYTEYFYQFATVLSGFHQYTKAARILKWLVDRDPENETLHNTWLQIVWKQGNIKAIKQASVLATDRFPNNPDFNQIRLEALAQSESTPAQEVEQASKRFAIRYCNSRPQPTHPTRYHHDKPRIAYILKDADPAIIKPILENHNQDRFDIFVYSNDTFVHQMWQGNLRPFTPDPLTNANQMLADEIDVLITMSNHSCVLELLALRPVALQGSWLCTTRSLQLPYLDFVIADRNLIPLNERDDWSEYILELPIWAPYEFTDNAPEITTRPEQAPITFGVFQKRSKITHRMMKLWSKILSQVPNSRLKLRDSAFTDPHVIRAVIREAIAAGISSHQIELVASSGNDSDFYQDIDICLDCFPFGGGSDIMKNLWMGIPVVTHSGEFFTSRISATYLRNIGREDWIATNSEQYIEIALTLARDHQTRAEFHQTCRETLKGSLVTQSQVLTTLLESRISQLYRAAQNL